MTEALLERHRAEPPVAEGIDLSAESLFILGQTHAGQPFRPSDWVDRMAGLFASFGKDKKLRYSPWVQPAILDGTRVLRLEAGLRQRDPSAFAFVMAFADSHGLAVRPAVSGQS
ncbi:MAG: DUF3579 domain-containing protein [Hydrogenophilaceae bacterium]